MPTLFLASASPRRAELLGQIGVPFQRVSASIDETPRVAEEPVAYVERLALEKAQAGLQRLERAADAVVLGADTAVVLDGRILGKPQDRADALAMLAKKRDTITALIAEAQDRKRRIEALMAELEANHPAQLAAG